MSILGSPNLAFIAEKGIVNTKPYDDYITGSRRVLFRGRIIRGDNSTRSQVVS